MRIRRLLGKAIPGLLAAVLLFAPVKAYAADGDPIVDNGNGEISILYRDRHNDPVKNMQVRVYRVAAVSGKIVKNAAEGYTVTYSLTEDFKQFDETGGSIRVTGFSEDALNDALVIRSGENDATRRARWQTIAQTLEPYAIAEVDPAGWERTDGNGVVNFRNLSPGLYLLIADGMLVQEGDADWRYRYDPTFVALPKLQNGVWDYSTELDFSEGNAQLRPKYRYEKQEYEYEVFKRFVGDDTTVRPTSIRIDIYRDGVFHQTVYLSEANDWHYKWVAGRHNWTVIERATGENYSVELHLGKDSTFTFVNTYNPPPPPPPPPPPEDEDILGVRRGPGEEEDPAVFGVRRGDIPEVLGARRLPQTGQLWWPVPLLVIGGIGLFLAGLFRRKHS